MRVLFQNRPDSYDMKGGDTVQMFKTKEYLAGLGVEGEIDLSINPDLSGYDLVHVFNINVIHSSLFQALNAKRQGKPVALSTIYNPNLAEWDKKGRYGSSRFFFKYASLNTKERAKSVIRLINPGPNDRRPLAHQLMHGYRRQVVETLKASDLLLPNSQMEMDTVEEVFGVKRPGHVVPNGAETHFADAQKGKFSQEYGIRDFVICVANFYSVKNQLALARAMAPHPEIPVIFIGKKSSNHQSYYDVFTKFISKHPQMKVFDFIPHDVLRNAYADARVHVLPSWTETTGLVSLEAALAGCNIVTTDRGFTREYFQDLAWYCQPDDIESIRKATLAAYSAPHDDRLKNRILENYTWQRAAEETLAGYKKLLASR